MLYILHSFYIFKTWTYKDINAFIHMSVSFFCNISVIDRMCWRECWYCRTIYVSLERNLHTLVNQFYDDKVMS